MQLRDLLTGGDRRSIAHASQALAFARDDSEAVAELACLTSDTDPLVAMRACDVLEKLLHEDVTQVQPYKDVFIRQLQSPFWESRLQCVRALPLFHWSAEERPAVIQALRERIDDEQKFVRCWALDGFALLVAADPGVRAELDQRLAEFLGSGVPSMQARARAIVKRLPLTD